MKMGKLALVLVISCGLVGGCARYKDYDDTPAGAFGQPVNTNDQYMTQYDDAYNYTYNDPSAQGYADYSNNYYFSEGYVDKYNTHYNRNNIGAPNYRPAPPQRHAAVNAGPPAEVPFDQTRKPRTTGNVGAS